MTPTAFELKVLRRLSHGTTIHGNGMVAWVAAAQRMERRGWLRGVTYCPRWLLTEAGCRALGRAEVRTVVGGVEVVARRGKR